MQRCFVIIDGSNFYYKLKELKFSNLLEFKFGVFAKHLCGANKLVESMYYIGAVRENPKVPKTKKLLADQQKLFAKLKREGFKYSLGYLLKTDRYHEKGVDVNMAVDILVGAYENLYDRVILVSSDTDLLPAVTKAKQKGRTVEYVGFSHQPSLALIKNCSESRLLKKDALEAFFPK